MDGGSENAVFVLVDLLPIKTRCCVSSHREEKQRTVIVSSQSYRKHCP
jgi:hypothetical protein